MAYLRDIETVIRQRVLVDAHHSLHAAHIAAGGVASAYRRRPRRGRRPEPPRNVLAASLRRRTK